MNYYYRKYEGAATRAVEEFNKKIQQAFKVDPYCRLSSRIFNQVSCIGLRIHCIFLYIQEVVINELF